MIALMQPGLLELVGVGYVVVGGAVGWSLHQRLGWVGAVGAAAAWPVFVPLLAGPKPCNTPHRSRIDEVFAALDAVLTDPRTQEVAWRTDLGGLRDALQRADERIALVDRLLAGAGDAPVAALRDARQRAASELGEVLDAVVQLRFQIGLSALDGKSNGVRQQLATLLARARAIDEIEAFSAEGESW